MLSNLPFIGLPASRETRIALEVGGVEYTFWKSVSINRSIDQISGAFSLTVSNRHDGDNSQWKIYLGAECKIKVAGQIIIDGYIDEVNVAYSADSNSIQFKGRDVTADLVDCCPDGIENELMNLTPLQIIKKVCDPFAIEVDVIGVPDDELIKPRSKFTIDSGAKAFEIIAELCEQLAYLPISLGDRKLYLTRAGEKLASEKLESGVNILSASLSQSDRQRYSEYVVNGAPVQATAFSSIVPVQGRVEDQQIRRFRPLVVDLSKAATSDDDCQVRAAWEARYRAGKARTTTVSVNSWTQKNGDVWPLNGLVQYRDLHLGIEDELLICSIDLFLGAGGEITSMDLVHPDTYKLIKREPVPDKPRTAFDKGSASKSQSDLIAEFFSGR
jgi:prophage tail gpP-like protein